MTLFDTKTPEERAARQRRREAREGLERVEGWIHPHQVPAMRQLFAMLKAAPGLEVGSPRNYLTGRLHKLR